MDTTLSIIAIIISVYTLVVLRCTLKHNINIQNVNFGPYLQFIKERIELGSTNRPSFYYATELANKGLKPMSVTNVWMRYGDSENKSSQRFCILSSFTLGPGEKRKIEFKRNQEGIMEIIKQLYLSECVFSLEVEYNDLSKQIRNEKRKLGGYTYMNGEIGVLFHSQGEMLT